MIICCLGERSKPYQRRLTQDNQVAAGVVVPTSFVLLPFLQRKQQKETFEVTFTHIVYADSSITMLRAYSLPRYYDSLLLFL